jgi:rhodanese-related sulfurtransferase
MSHSESRAAIGLAALLLAAASLACGAEPGAGAAMAPDELAARIAAGDAPLVLDVRTPEEYAAGHVPGAVNIPHDQLAGRLGELGVPKSGEIVVHCEVGRRAEAAEAVLHEAGYTNVLDLTGHMAAWRSAGLPLQQ